MKTGHLKSLAKPVPVCTVTHVLKKNLDMVLENIKETAKTKKNEEKSILVPIQNMKEYYSWFGRQSGVVVVQENLPNEQG